MATVFVLRAFSLSGELMAEPKRLTALPIRIGRNPLNDFVVGHGGVSSFHARIEDVEGRLCVIDLGSKNGVLLVGGGPASALVPHQPQDLQPSGFQFFLGANVRCQIAFEEQHEALEQRGPSIFRGLVVGNASMMLEPTPSHPPPAARVPSAPPPGPVGFAPPAPGAFGAPSAVPLAALGHSSSPPPMPAPFPASAFQSAAVAAQPLPGGASGPGGRAATGFLQGLSDEAMALQGLRELAGSLVPGVALDTTGDIARFITKLHDSIEAFCRSFVPLRESHSQFMSSFDLQRALRRTMMRSTAYAAVEGARTPDALAAALLNPKDRNFDGPQAVEGILADLMLHQLALLEGVMRGVGALLEELSPANVQNQAGGGLSLSRHKALWNKYVEIFENVSEERQAFAVIFGPEFTAAYRQYRQNGGQGSL